MCVTVGYRLEGQLESRQSDLERVRQVNSDLEREIAASRVKEAELLDFTQKLTEKNVRLQSEFSANETKVSLVKFPVCYLFRYNDRQTGIVARLVVGSVFSVVRNPKGVYLINNV